MRTPDMSDEELDRLFRHGAEAYPDEVSLSGWLKLEEQLTEAARQQQLRQRVRRQVSRLFVAEMALVVLLALCWQLRPGRAPWQSSSTRTSVSSVRPLAGRLATTAPSVRPRHANPASSTGREAAPAARPATTLPAPVRASAELVATRQYATAGTATTGTAAAAPTRPKLLQQLQWPSAGVVAAAKHEKPEAPPARVPVAAAAYEAAAAGETVPNEASAAGAPATNAPDTVVSAASAVASLGAPVATADTTATAASAAGPARVALAPAPDTTRVVVLRQPVVYRWLVGVQGAPTVSAVRTAQTARLGGDLGLTLEYRLTSRWRVRTGLRRSVKRYAAASADYTAPAAWGWWPGTYAVNANCRITEIPLDLRYDLLSRPSYRLFTSLGLTSLLMRNERYNYDFQVNGQTRTLAVQVVNGAVHPFGAVSFSAGLERSWGSRWAGQVEPYLQLPLGNVGAGQVKLSSAGLLLGVKYGLFRPRTTTP